MSRAVLAFGLALALGACRGSARSEAPVPASAPADEPAVAAAAADVVAPPSTPLGVGAAAHPTLKPMPKTPIFVGGCRDACREPISAFDGFLAALIADPEGKAIVPFLNTAELVVNGERLGDRWAELWKRGQWPERQADVEAFTRSFLAWTRTLDDPGALEAARKQGVRVLKDESERAEIVWHHPGVTGDLTAADWRFVLKPRGLEWLIVDIDQYTKGDR